MTSRSNTQEDLNLADRKTLSLLATLEEGSPITQRSLAVRLGVALGLTNSLLKRAIRKGLIKVSQAPAKRYAYYVTPKGFQEKGRLVAEYLSTSLHFFRQAREEYVNAFHQIRELGHKRIALIGTGELAEIVLLSAEEARAELCCAIQSGSNKPKFSNLQVFTRTELALSQNIDAVIIASMENSQNEYNQLRKHFDDDQIFSVPLLHITRNNTGSSQ